ncbi:YgaP family membrane protein [Azospirillum sp. sgz301742]
MLGSNVGGVDRALRAVVGLILIALVFVGPQTPWGWVGLIPLLTAVIGFCPAYTLLGVKTCSTQR